MTSKDRKKAVAAANRAIKKLNDAAYLMRRAAEQIERNYVDEKGSTDTDMLLMFGVFGTVQDAIDDAVDPICKHFQEVEQNAGYEF